jgi:putative ubiquitin-RnfH superfamily antitoxin RatB of RatAB toxin-antitoxin module
MVAEAHAGGLWVEVAYATPERQVILRVEVPVGSTVTEAVELSGIREHFPDLKVEADRVGVFSRKVTLEYVLQQGDRVEIYRPLIADPKEARRKRASKNADA